MMEYRAAWCSGVLQPPGPPLNLKQSQASKSSLPVAPTLAPSQSSGAWRKCLGSLSWVRCCHHLPTRLGQTGA